MKTLTATLASATLLTLGVTIGINDIAQAAAVRNVAGFNDNSLPANDDGSTGLVPVGFDLNFFGVTTDDLYVNNNGNVTLDQPLSTFTPFDLTSTARQIIAPFFADVDTRSAGELVHYGNGTVDGRNAFGVNWLDVDYFVSSTGHTNRNYFQLVLIDRSDTGAGNFDIEFNYDQIQWESGQASGSDVNGLGGFSARAGYSNGTGDAGTFYELPGSAVNGAFLDGGPDALISHSLNSDVLGRYLFAARDGEIIDPDPNDPTTPEPNALYSLLALGFLGGVSKIRSRK